MRRNLLAWQWADYSSRHQNRTNLILHIFAVPVFQFGTVLMIYALLALSITAIVIALLVIVSSLIIQGRGHKLEPEQPLPFVGPLDMPTRLIAEQWVTFPRFVLTGGWYRNYKATIR